MKIKSSLSNLRYKIIQELEERHPDSHFYIQDGPVENFANQSDWKAYDWLVIEENHNLEESYEHWIASTSHNGEDWDVDFGLSY